MLDVRRLRLLRELALRGTIAAVAEALVFSPSAVSQQLATLEREAGVPLLERTGRGVALTPAAHALVAHAEVILDRLEQAASDLADRRHGPAGPVRIGVFPTATRTVAVAALALLGTEHPGLEPRLSEIDPAAVGDALRAGDLDLALVHDYDLLPALDEPGIATSAPLFTEVMLLATTTQEPTLTGCAHAPWITATPATRCHDTTVRACHAAGFAPAVRHRIDDFTAVLALVAAGHGVALVPELAAGDPPPGVVLTPLPIRRRTTTACRAGAERHPAILATASALRRAGSAASGSG
ncbi:LysR family transcriptional regulator [Pseudonocardia abyssalis]|uniref:LysR family transcriptional regulator n=1 Tax=Pseudonocardia abyssalis TaxID=2792008 RepID=A0ABS6USR0_9PSEU|nr:LysR family transcriptional regulator [Pseudonocardia abyssalis]MBW0116373.1 LysR family transcriptional regulator [Pseudonocardia abyssalis]MBW0135304.1 LysR family transcriptional regulator [Pseudonocardia abyssalis]